jgi:two-component system, NtrC family, response regulator AtoC
VNARILVIDPDSQQRACLEGQLRARGHRVVAVADSEQAQAVLSAVRFDIVICDLELGRGAEGAALLNSCARPRSNPTLIMCSHSDKDEALAEAARMGAFDHLAKPFQASAVLMAVSRAHAHEAARRARALLDREFERCLTRIPIVAASPCMIELLEEIDRVAALEEPILLIGESGVGKESIARVIHAQSPRRHGPFVALDCCATRNQTLEALLWGGLEGQVDRAGERSRGLLCDASQGTLYLAGIPALPARLQEQLLHVLRIDEGAENQSIRQEAELPRLLVSSVVVPHASASHGEFSESLLARLGSARLLIPPLRERRDDLVLLADHFLARARRRQGQAPIHLSDEAIESLRAYAWPGNIEELRNVIAEAALFANGDHLMRNHLPERLRSAAARVDGVAHSPFSLRSARKRIESDLIRQALRETGGNRTHAARLLEISHRALLYKIKEHRIRD